MQQKFRFAWVAVGKERPSITTSPFLKVWRSKHKATCSGHGERVHVFQGLYFGDAPINLHTDIECLGCGEHYREAAK